jgi:hypothetical protein
MAPKLAANQLAPIERTQYPKEFEIVRGILLEAFGVGSICIRPRMNEAS